MRLHAQGDAVDDEDVGHAGEHGRRGHIRVGAEHDAERHGPAVPAAPLL